MTSVRATTGLMVLLLISIDSRAEDSTNELKALEGQWRLVGFERGGVARSPDRVPAGWISFEKDGRFAASFPDHDMGGTVQINPAAKPASIDFSHTRGLDEGQSMFAIYKREGTRLLLCSAPPGRPVSERPSEFSTRGTDRVLFIFQRPAFVPAPPGFDARRDSIERGRIETVEYDSKTVGARRRLLIYTPPGYSKSDRYPVLYLLHGAGQDESAWHKHGSAELILDNLYADQKLVPMIVVMPNAATSKPARPEAPFAPFDAELLHDIIPCVESRYPVHADREHRAIAGLSKGGAQAVWIGLKHRDQFAWIGGFCSALHGDAETTAPVVRDLIGDPGDPAKQLRLLWLSCGDADELLQGNEYFHVALEDLRMPHIWHVESGGHTWPVWKNDIYLFSQLLFRESP